MQAYAKSVHAIEMLNRSSIMLKIAIAIQTTMAEGREHGCEIIGAGDTAAACFTRSPTYFVQKHAYQLVRHIGFGPPCSFPQSLTGIKGHLRSSPLAMAHRYPASQATIARRP
jgi:hypothetical protein